MKLRIGHFSTIYHTALTLMSDSRLEQGGIEASFRIFGGGPQIVGAMGRDEIDIGYIGLPPAMIGMVSGIRIKCVAGGHMEGTVLSLCSRITPPEPSDSEAMVIRRLKGLRIGSPPKGCIHDIILRHMLKIHEVKAEILNYPWADFIPLAMERGEIDAAIGTPALAVYLKRNLGARIALPPSKIWPHNPSYGIIVREDLLGSEALRTFLALHEEACNELIRTPVRAAETASQILGFINPDFALAVIRLSPRYCAALPQRFIRSTMRFVKPMVEMGYLPRPLDEKEIFHTGIIEDLHREPDHYNKLLKLA